jgi:hypothetical protein
MMTEIEARREIFHTLIECREGNRMTPARKALWAYGVAWTKRVEGRSAGRHGIILASRRRSDGSMADPTEKWEDQPLPKQTYCCAHSPTCAVHQPPFDARVVTCTCTERGNRGRHRYSPPDPRLSLETGVAD